MEDIEVREAASGTEGGGGDGPGRPNRECRRMTRGPRRAILRRGSSYLKRRLRRGCLELAILYSVEGGSRIQVQRREGSKAGGEGGRFASSIAEGGLGQSGYKYSAEDVVGRRRYGYSVARTRRLRGMRVNAEDGLGRSRIQVQRRRGSRAETVQVQRPRGIDVHADERQRGYKYRAEERLGRRLVRVQRLRGDRLVYSPQSGGTPLLALEDQPARDLGRGVRTTRGARMGFWCGARRRAWSWRKETQGETRDRMPIQVQVEGDDEARDREETSLIEGHVPGSKNVLILPGTSLASTNQS